MNTHPPAERSPILIPFSARSGALVLTAVLVLLIELGATISSLNSQPSALVVGWSPTRSGDLWAVLITVLGSAAVFALSRLPLCALVLTSGSYLAFMLRDYEFGMTLPAMVVIFVLAARGTNRFPAAAAAFACVAGTMLWIGERTATIVDDGTAILVWVAFGMVSAAFFFLPLLFGELVRLRRQGRRAARSHAPSVV